MIEVLGQEGPSLEAHKSEKPMNARKPFEGGSSGFAVSR